MNISDQDRDYRRGVVAGLTMAEIMILILFALLLLMAYRIEQQSGAAMNPKLEQHVREAAKSARAAGVTAENLDEFFRVLELAWTRGDKDTTGALRDLLREITTSGVATPEPGRRGSALLPVSAADVQTSETTTAQRAGAPGVAAGGNGLRPEDIRRKIDALRRVAEAMRSGNGTGQLDDLVAATRALIAAKPSLPAGRSAEDIIRDAVERERRTARFAQESARSQRPGGAGTEHPACWISAETGKPEYIFDVALTRKTISVHDNALPWRASEQAQLPLKAMTYDQTVSLNKFLEMTLPVFDWSREKGCRFFVRAVDRTEPHEKAIYKRELRIVGDRFYPFEDLGALTVASF